MRYMREAKYIVFSICGDGVRIMKTGRQMHEDSKPESHSSLNGVKVQASWESLRGPSSRSRLTLDLIDHTCSSRLTCQTTVANRSFLQA